MSAAARARPLGHAPWLLSWQWFVAAGGREQALREENDSLRWQLDSYRTEAELLRTEQVRNRRPDQEQPPGPEVQVQLLQQSLHSRQQVGPAGVQTGWFRPAGPDRLVLCRSSFRKC